MKCPNCNIEMDKGICLKCGYMENGNYIEQFKKEDKNTEIRIYNEDYDEMNTNQKKYLNFLLGPFYFSYRNHLITGFLTGIIAFLILYFEIILTQALTTIGSIFTLVAFLNITIYVIINRIFYMGFSNVICLAIDKHKIKKIKKKENYMDILVNHKSRSIAKIIIQVLLYIMLITIIIKINL